MRLLVVNPPSVYNRGESPFIVFPLGLGYLAAVLENAGFSVRLLDCVGESPQKKTGFGRQKYLLGLDFKEIEDRISQHSPDIILLSCCFSLQFEIVARIAAIAKSLNQEVRVIVGGSHPSAVPEDVLSDQNIDFVVVGEAEKSVVSLVKAIAGHKSYSGISAVCYRREGKSIINRHLDLVNNPDILPFPARHLFSMDVYCNSKYRHTMIHTNKRVAQVITSRGCPYNCSFCASHAVHARVWRPRSVENVISEIKHLKSVYNVREIHFEDDNIALDRQRFVSLCKEIGKLNVIWTCPNGINVSSLDVELISLMRKSGCYALYLPIESANKKIFAKHIKKIVSSDRLGEVISRAKEENMYLVGFFLLGFYEESLDDIQKTISLANSLGLDEAHFSIVTPLPGSRYYAEHNVKSVGTAKTASMDTVGLTVSQVNSVRNKAYRSFELNKLLHRPLTYLDSQQFRRLFRYIKYFINSSINSNNDDSEVHSQP